MATKPEIINKIIISGTMIDSVEIPTFAILGFSTTTSSNFKEMIETMTDNLKQQYGRLNRKYFISARHGCKPQNCRWNFDAICHSSRVISISGFGGHIAISGCRSLSVPLLYHSMGQIIKSVFLSVYVCMCVCVCGHAYGRIFQPIFTKFGKNLWGLNRKN